MVPGQGRRRRGARRASAIDNAASGNNPGGLTPRWGAGIPGPLDALAMQAFRLHLDSGFPTAPKSTINLAFDDGDVADLERLAGNYDGADGFATRWLEPHELRAIEPRLADDVVAGLRADGDARIASAEYTAAVRRAARGRGTTTVVGEAAGLRTSVDRATGVVVDSETLDCDAVVLATGAWSAPTASWLGSPSRSSR